MMGEKEKNMNESTKEIENMIARFKFVNIVIDIILSHTFEVFKIKPTQKQLEQLAKKVSSDPNLESAFDILDIKP